MKRVSSNSYTGRPTGEMSLYTSSMNSSESNNYRLRMYVDESYNPQGDGGNLSFSVQINVYGKDGEKYVPLTTREILEDNELQEKKIKCLIMQVMVCIYQEYLMMGNPNMQQMKIK